MYPQRPRGHQALQDQNSAPGHQLHRVPDGCSGQRLRGNRGLQGRDQEVREQRHEEETGAGEFSLYRARHGKLRSLI